MTDAKAEEILLRLKAAGLVDFDETVPGRERTYTGKLAQAALPVDRLAKMKLQLMKQNQIHDPDVLAEWENYRYYVPLKGREMTIADEVAVNRPPGKRRVAAVENLQRQALGRTDRAQNPIVPQLLLDVGEALETSEDVRAARRLFELARQFPNLRTESGLPLFQLTEQPIERYQDAKGVVRFRPEEPAALRNNEIRVPMPGREYILAINDPRVASAVRGLSKHQVGKFGQAIGKVNRTLARVHTTWNPEFVFTNLIRDLATANIQMSREETASIGKRMRRLLLPAARGLHQEIIRQQPGEWTPWIRRFREAGAKIEFAMLPDVEQLAKNMAESIKREAGEPGNVMVSSVKQLGQMMTDWNEVVENISRLATFRAAIDSGLTDEKAANLARNVTVDFTQTGDWGPVLNSFILFANADRGSGTILQGMMRSPKFRGVLASIAAAGFGWANVNRVMGGTDEDGEYWYDKVPNYTRERNIIFVLPNSGGKYFKVPLPYGFNVPWVMGGALSNMIHGQTPGESGMEIVNSITGAFNPLGDGDLFSLAGWAQMATPTPLRPFADVVLNRNFFGAPLRPEQPRYGKAVQYGAGRPDSQLYFNTVSPLAKWVSQALNKAGGGDEWTPAKLGLLDVSPETIDHWYENLTGGTGRMLRSVVTMIQRRQQGKKIPANDIPMVRRFLGEQSEWLIPQTYRANMGEMYRMVERGDGILEKYGPEEAQAHLEKNQELYRIVNRVKELEKRITAAKRRETEQGEEVARRLMTTVNRLFREAEQRMRR